MNTSSRDRLTGLSQDQSLCQACRLTSCPRESAEGRKGEGKGEDDQTDPYLTWASFGETRSTFVALCFTHDDTGHERERMIGRRKSGRLLLLE